MTPRKLMSTSDSPRSKLIFSGWQFPLLSSHAVNFYIKYHPSSSDITRCQVPSPFRSWFHYSAGDIDFYQMSLSQSESTILHESIILYKYWLHERVTWEIINPRKPMITVAIWFSRGDNFPCYPLVQSIINILYWMLIKHVVYITSGFKTIQWISYSVNSNAHTTPVRTYGEPYAHKYCAVDIFWKITRRQAISPVAKFDQVLGRCFMLQRVILL